MRERWQVASGKWQVSARNDGFTLLEVLVAMSILMMIVMMMATLFSQSTTAWDRGIDSAKLSLKGRAVMRMMQHDLSQAIADGGLDRALECNFGSSSFEVCTVGQAEDDTDRVTRWVRYELSGAKLRRSEVPLKAVRPAGTPNYANDGAMVRADLVDGVTSFSVTVPPGGPYTTNLPAWDDLKLVFSEKVGESAGITVWSIGRDDTSDTKDDISTDRND